MKKVIVVVIIVVVLAVIGYALWKKFGNKKATPTIVATPPQTAPPTSGATVVDSNYVPVVMDLSGGSQQAEYIPPVVNPPLTEEQLKLKIIVDGLGGYPTGNAVVDTIVVQQGMEYLWA